ncbi:DEAD/DEAH box helicase [Steroidobacter sp. S1-65]|uniref:DEAD/DEAH box helicase n=2 Tax=Steroidobacter gossypii TaxID=2805490 RepID=A0ABS1WZY9_9GAMM|nr:DEAD/DEAH box helicase [Steroidobacter gossypii]
MREMGWALTFREDTPARAPGWFDYHDLPLSAASRSTLSQFRDGIYQHQREGILRYLGGAHLAVTTATASGKTLIFNICALEELAKPGARVLAIYPLKALAAEQTMRWQTALKQAGIDAKVGRIDGGIAMSERQRILKESRVLVMTPDIIHAWLFSVIDAPVVVNFLKNLTLVVTDEAHTYSGVFGSNAAFLFRRLLHAVRKLGGQCRFIASSATMKDPTAHLLKLTGESFETIGPELDTSPRAERRTLLVSPPKSKDLLTAVSDLLIYAAANTSHQSITFVDSRKQTEYLAAIVERRVNEESEDADAPVFERLRDMQIYPYRSGYEEEDRERIQGRLAAGALKGVVSTSALEMGIDLPYLSLGVLYGIPSSATSLHQRIGRVGRRKPGLIIIVNNGSVISESVFRAPERIGDLPLAQSALYLHNRPS